MNEDLDEAARATIAAFARAYSPRELFNHLAVIFMKEPPRSSLPMIAKVFEACGYDAPNDWFAWATHGKLTDAEVLEWESLVPEKVVAIQPRRSKRLAIGAKGWIAHPTQMEAWGEPISLQ